MEPDKAINPYQSPSAEVISASSDTDIDFIDGGQTVPMSNGLSWIGTGWSIFTQAPIAWIVCTIIIFVISVVLGFIPIIGQLISNVLFVVFAGGLMLGCQQQHTGRPFEIGDLFSGFKEKAGPLMIVGLLFIASSILLLIIAGILFAIFVGSTGLFGAMMSGNQEALTGLFAGSIMMVLFIGLVMLALTVPIAMALWFAPVLVALQNITPMAALRMSFFASLKNTLPFLVYGIIFFVIFIVAVLPFGLGLLVAIPLVYTSTYAAYRDIFLAE